MCYTRIRGCWRAARYVSADHHTGDSLTEQIARSDRAHKSGRDLAPVAVALMEDASDVDGARRIRLIAAGRDSADGHTARAIIQLVAVEALPKPLTALQEASQPHALPDTPTRPPTGPGAPSAASKRKRKTTSPKRPAILRLQPPEPPAERVRIALASEPQLSIRALARTAGVSLATASKWRRVLGAEREGKAAL